MVSAACRPPALELIVRSAPGKPSLLSQKKQCGERRMIRHSVSDRSKGELMGAALVTGLILLILVSFPKWNYNREWGYAFSGFFTLSLAIVLVLICCTDKLTWGF